MANSLNTYLLILKNNFTNAVHQFTVKNISENDMFYEFEMKDILDDLPDGEYNYYLIWNTYDDYELRISNDILDSVFVINGQEIILNDTKPECGILKIVNSNEKTNQPFIDKNTHYIAYDR